MKNQSKSIESDNQNRYNPRTEPISSKTNPNIPANVQQPLRDEKWAEDQVEELERWDGLS